MAVQQYHIREASRGLFVIAVSAQKWRVLIGQGFWPSGNRITTHISQETMAHKIIRQTRQNRVSLRLDQGTSLSRYYWSGVHS